MTARPAFIACIILVSLSSAAAACDCDTYPFKPDSCASICRATALSKAGEQGLSELGYDPAEVDLIRGKSPQEIKKLFDKEPGLQDKIGKRLDGIRATGVDKIR